MGRFLSASLYAGPTFFVRKLRISYTIGCLSANICASSVLFITARSLQTMSDEFRTPSVVDLDALLQPISDEEPCGESLRYSGIYDEIAEARRSDDVLNQGEWQTELKTADYRKVVDLATEALRSKTKDLQIAAWLSEALVKLHGFAGLRDSLQLLAGLQDRFWDGLFPLIDEGDMEGRANAISWVDNQAAAALRTVPMTAGAGYSFNDWQDAKRFDIPPNLDSLDGDTQARFADLKAQAEAENRVTGELWKVAVAQTRRDHCERNGFALDECWTAFHELNDVIERNFDRNQMPGLGTLRKSIDDVHTQVKKLLEKKRLEEPRPEDLMAEATSDSEVSAGGASAASGSGPAGPVRNRAEALARLAEIAAFFQRTEPHSPVAYLVQRAVKWGNMPLENWLTDVIKDEAVLSQLKETLGLGSSGYSSGDSWSDDQYAAEPQEDNSASASDDW